LDFSKSRALSPAHTKALADWNAFASKARLDQFRMRLKLDELRGQMRKAKERERLSRIDWEGIRLRDPKTRWNI
jgi:hypothetical protein